MSSFLRAATVLAVLLAALPRGASAQGIADLLEAIQVGGGWIRIPIEAGKGALTTLPVPSGGRTLDGCMEIWNGHSGRWRLRVTDTFGNGELDAEAAPAQDIPFSYAPGPMARLAVDVEWSEPRDTTLLVWIGLDRPNRPRDPCEPVYSGSR